jgi:hypothetical protein
MLKDDFNKACAVLHLLLRYTQALITQMSQTAVCNRHHLLDQQLCRWLLLSLEAAQTMAAKGINRPRGFRSFHPTPF